ncbi:MAG: cytochrome c [Acidobacteria bacterium]|nr:cytochrome c [Acidobacteriota bacterium]
MKWQSAPSMSNKIIQPTFSRRLAIHLTLLAAVSALPFAHGHEIITTQITFNQTIFPIIQANCAACHRAGGMAFSLMTYQEARPWAAAIQEEVLRRRMPPWGAVRGFGHFRNDPSLTQTQLQQIAEWAEGGAPEGAARAGPASGIPLASTIPRRDDLIQPVSAESVIEVGKAGERFVLDFFELRRDVTLSGIQFVKAAEKSSFRIRAVLPDGSVIALVWIYEFRAGYSQPYIFAAPLRLPAGTRIQGVPADAQAILLIEQP